MPIVVGLGGGVDSVEATLELLRDPIALRYLREGAVMMAQTGHEWPDTADDLEQVLFPRLAEARVRTIQVARRGLRKRDGVVILDDTDRPNTCYIRPTPGRWYFTLGREMLLGGTIPQLSGARTCSQRSKGTPLDEVREQQVTRGRRYLHLVGFEVREARRIARDQRYDTDLRCGWYPLAEQGKDRAACLAGIRDKTGRTWSGKSACSFCPFSLTGPTGRTRTLDRFERFPEEGALPLAMEEVAVRLNPAQGLAGMDKRTRTGIRLLTLMAARPALAPILAEHQARLERIRWAVYLVQRAVLTPTNVPRRIVALHTGNRAEMQAQLDQLARHAQVDEIGGVRRVWRRRRGPALPTAEEFYVAAPFIGAEKHRPGFWRMWGRTQ
ncbi:hypothetical protein [Nonomuraea wenchangensis]|uniref:hypothetical protein n=1 Tax=Nonomuraea wenchangensis TaxID=568860 RepID=UPI0033318D9B